VHYTEKDIQVLTDSVGFVRRNPDMFLRLGEPNIHDFVENIVSTALLLGANKINVIKHDEWMFISSNVDWTKNDERDAFSRILPFPEAGVNSCRPEVILVAFCTSVLFKTKHSGIREINCGEPLGNIKQVLDDLDSEAILAFKL